jgi:hypothetical protein
MGIWRLFTRRPANPHPQGAVPLIVFPNSDHQTGQFPRRPSLRSTDPHIPIPVAARSGPPPPSAHAPASNGKSTAATQQIPVAIPAPRYAPVAHDGGEHAPGVAPPVDEHPAPRFSRMGDGTLQFLPGRLEIMEGLDAGQEIRFVRTAGPNGTQVTLGRSEGEPYRHVQLREQTVSRLHARLSYDGHRWRLSNLSATNPVVYNGAPLEGTSASIPLSDGDRLEMGEVVLRFRER